MSRSRCARTSCTSPAPAPIRWTTGCAPSTSSSRPERRTRLQDRRRHPLRAGAVAVRRSVASRAMPDITMPRLSDSMEEGTILKWLKAEGDDVSKGEELVEIETDKATMTYEADADGTLEIVADEGSTLAIGEVIARIGEGGGASSEADGGASEKGEQEASAGDDGGDEDSGGGTATKTEEEPEAEEDEGAGEEPSEDEGDEDEGDESGDEAAAAEAEEPEPAQAKADSDGGGDGDGKPAAKADGDGGDGKPAAQAERTPSAEGNGGRPKASPVARRIAREHGIDLSTLEGSGPGGRIVKADVEAAASGAAEVGD